MKKSKEEIIRKRLFRYKRISRNWVIRNLYYTHLWDCVFALRKNGFNIIGEYEKPNRTGDFIYRLVK